MLEHDPWIKEKIAEGVLKGRVEGALQVSRHLLVTVVRTRFPELGQGAERAAEHTADPEILARLIERVVQATNASEVRQRLEECAAAAPDGRSKRQPEDETAGEPFVATSEGRANAERRV